MTLDQILLKKKQIIFFQRGEYRVDIIVFNRQELSNVEKIENFTEHNKLKSQMLVNKALFK